MSVSHAPEDVDDDHWTVDQRHIEKLQERYKNEEFPLFMDSVPHDAQGNPHLQALQHIMFEEQTPEERALSYKDQGNEHFQDALQSDRKKTRLEAAVQCYTKGIEEQSQNASLNSLLYSNRAHARLLLRDFPGCVDDCRAAIRENDKNIKAYFRAAKASYYLHLFAQCIMFCNDGLRHDPSNAPLSKLLEQVEKIQSDLKQKRQQQDAAASCSLKSEQSELLKAFEKRGLTVANSCDYDATLLQTAPAWLDEEHTLHWCCILLYPEYAISEAILDFNENQSLLDHLKVMFPGGDSFAPWDTSCRYLYSDLVAYYEGGFPDGAMCQIQLDVPLATILTALRRVPKVPVVHIMVRDSATELNFKNENVLLPFPRTL